MGDWTASAGRAGEAPSVQVSNNLSSLGFPLHRLKTGTPPRIDARTIDFSKTVVQPGSSVPLDFAFSYYGHDKPVPLVPPAYPKVYPHQQLEGWRPQLPCYLVHTTPHTHDLIRANLHRAPMFTGVIEGVGPRYCPSIEDKVVRFADKQSHQLFLEPEGWLTNEVYVQGANTSLPADVQQDLIRSVPGLEKAEIVRFGYAVEYDAVPSTEIRASMETKRIANLFLAGQINGTSGYEEAAGQGLLAGINAALRASGREPFILKREQAYIGVMIDDLTTKEIKEPYRLMTSRAEYRLLLRSDNADLRLTTLGYELGLIGRERYLAVENKRDRIEEYIKRLAVTPLSPSAHQNSLFVAAGFPAIERGMKAADYLRRPEVSRAALPLLLGEEVDPEIGEQVEIESKYRTYISKQEQSVDKMRRLEDTRLPDSLDYEEISGLRNEARARLGQFKPATLGQASRLSGVNPADVAVLMVHLQRRANMASRQRDQTPELTTQEAGV